MPKREGNNPKRRIVDKNTFSADFFENLTKKVRYGGSANHKRRPGDYGFHPAQNPRPNKSLCDSLRSILWEEANQMLMLGIMNQMVSRSFIGEFPKYIWSVDADGEAYEAKVGEDLCTYHGYRLGDDEAAFRKWVIETWNTRVET